MPGKLSKEERHIQLQKLIRVNPALTDEELSAHFSVSVPTIRLDRIALGIAEQKERLKTIAEGNMKKIRSLSAADMIGELISLEPGKSGISFLQTDQSMVFERTKVVRGQYIYAFAETIAISVIDAAAALVGVANIKYVKPVNAGAKLFAYADVKRVQNNNFIVWVMIKENSEQVFRGKFILVSI